MKDLLAGILLAAARLLPATLAVVGCLLLVGWFIVKPPEALHARLPGLDRPQETAADGTQPANLQGTLTRGDGVASSVSGEWPSFRGRKLDGIGDDSVRLARQWPADGPRVLWSVDLGEGYAGPAVWAGRVYLLDYDREASADALRCLSLDDGKELWCYRYPVAIKRNHGMSRTIPAIDGKHVVALGPKCHATCLDAVTGQRKWMIDLVRQYGTTVPPWYAGQCPLIENGRAILAPAGSALLMAVDCNSGEVVWKSPNPRAWKMTHVSITPMELAGQRMYVYCGKGGVAGVSADDGSILWETTDWKISIATCPSPVVLPEGKIFFCGGYNSGALMLEVSESGGRFSAKTLFRLKPSQFGSTQHTPIFDQGHLFGVREKDKQLVCLDLEGREVWASGPEHRFGIGPYMIADGLIYVMDDAGLLTLAEATTTGYHQLAQAQVLQGHESWAPMALVGGRLLARDLTRMVCLDVSEDGVENLGEKRPEKKTPEKREKKEEKGKGEEEEEEGPFAEEPAEMEGPFAEEPEEAKGPFARE
jgi:outer membrane protein assembly factor BamB